MPRNKIHIVMTDLMKVHNGESVTNWHHRKARKRGGKTNKKNLSKVRKDQHIAFHFFFPTRDGCPMSGNQVAMRTKDLYPRARALFANDDGTFKTAEQFIHELNTVWNDPNIEIVLDSSPDES